MFVNRTLRGFEDEPDSKICHLDSHLALIARRWHRGSFSAPAPRTMSTVSCPVKNAGAKHPARARPLRRTRFREVEARFFSVGTPRSRVRRASGVPPRTSLLDTAENSVPNGFRIGSEFRRDKRRPNSHSPMQYGGFGTSIDVPPLSAGVLRSSVRRLGRDAPRHGDR
jgi:hypothetical protein